MRAWSRREHRSVRFGLPLVAPVRYADPQRFMRANPIVVVNAPLFGRRWCAAPGRLPQVLKASAVLDKLHNKKAPTA